MSYQPVDRQVMLLSRLEESSCLTSQLTDESCCCHVYRHSCSFVLLHYIWSALCSAVHHDRRLQQHDRRYDNTTEGYSTTDGYNTTDGYDNTTDGYNNTTEGYSMTDGYNMTDGYDNTTDGYDNTTDATTTRQRATARQMATT